MKATPACPDSVDLIRLRDGDLPKGERAALVRHVTDCPYCRAALKKLIGGKTGVISTKPKKERTEVRESKKRTRPPEADQAGVTRSYEPEGTPVGDEPHYIPRSNDNSPEEWQGYLTPSERRGALGRLAHYEVLELIGRGGMGVVLKGFDEKLHRMVAIKLLAPNLAGSTTARKRFVREARAAAAVRDIHVVGIYDVDETGPLPFLVMEFIAGISLEKLLKGSGALELKDIVRIGIEIADGLTAAHKQGLVHRDIKPGNILLENETQVVKITDFGLARAVDDAGLTQTGVISGTPLFMAPEQALGENVDHRADLFSLGSVLYAMCTGHSPFRATSSMAVIRRVCDEPHKPIREVQPDIPEWFGNIIDQLLAKDREDRFDSAKVVADQLRRHLTHVPEPSRVAAKTQEMAETLQMPRGPLPRRKSRLMLYAACGVAVCVLVAVAALAPLLWFWTPVPAPKFADKEPFDVVTLLPSKAPVPIPFNRDKIPQRFLELAGGGNRDRAPLDLVAVFGEDNWLLPFGAKGSWIDQSPDGQLLAVPSNDSVALFDAETGKWINTLTGIRGRAYSVAFSPSGKQVAVGPIDGDNVIHLYDANSGRPLRTFQSSWPVYRLAFSPTDSKFLAAVGGSADKSGGGAVWNVNTGSKAFELVGLTSHTRSIAFAPNGSWLATASDDEKVRIWNGRNGTFIRDLNFLPKGITYGLAFSTDNKLLAGGNHTQTIAWSTDNWNPVEKPWDVPGEWLAFRGQSHLLLAAAHENKKYVVINNAPQTASLPYSMVEVDSKKITREPFSSAIGSHVVFGLHPKGDRVFFMTSEPQIVAMRPARDVDANGHIGPIQGEVPDPVEGLALGDDGRYLAVFKKAGDGRIWDLKTGQLGTSLPGPLGLVPYAIFNPDGTRLAIAAPGKVAIFNTRTGAVERQLTGVRSASPLGMQTISFSPDGKVLYAPGTDGSPKRWNTADGQMLTGEWGQEAKAVTLMAASADGKWVTTSGSDKSIRVLDATTGSVVKEFTVPAVPTALRFSLDSKTLVCAHTGPGGGQYPMWEVPSWKPLPALKRELDTGQAFAFHPTRRIVAASLNDGSVRLVQMVGETEQIHIFEPGLFGKVVKRVAFTPDGTCLAVGAENGTVMFLRVPDELGKSTSAPKGELFAKDSAVPGWGTFADPEGDCQVHSDGSSLTVTVPNKTPHLLGQPKQKLNAPRVLQQIQGDFVTEVRVNTFPQPLATTTTAASTGGPFVSAGLLIWQDEKNFIRWERAVVDGNSIRLRLERILGGKSAYRQEWDIYDPSTTLLVERAGTKFIFKTKESPNAAVWTERYVTNWVMPSPVKVGVYAINNTTKDFSPRLQAFKLTSVGNQPAVIAISGFGKQFDPDNDCKFVEAKSQLTILLPAIPHDLAPYSLPPRMNAPRLLQDAEGDFTLQVRIKAFSKPMSEIVPKAATPQIAAGLLVWQNDLNFIRFEVAASESAGHNLLLQRTLTGKPSKSLNRILPISSSDIYLQVARIANKLTFSLKEPGSPDWRTLDGYAWAAPLQVGLHAINTTGKPFSALFQEFNLSSESAKPGLAKKAVPVPVPPAGTFAVLPVPTALDLAKKASVADGFKRADIPADVLAIMGTGNGDAPKELVGVLGQVGEPQIVSLSLSKDGRYLATCGLRDNKALLFDLASGQQTKVFSALNAGTMTAISADGSTVLHSGGFAREAQLFDVATGKAQQSIKPTGSTVLETVFNPDGSLLAVGDNSGAVKLWDLRSKTERVLKPDLTQVNRMAFSPDGKFLAISGLRLKSREIVIQEIASEQIYGRLTGHTNSVLGLAWHPNGQILASGSTDGSIRLWDLSTMDEAQPPIKPGGSQIHGLAWHPSGQFLASNNHSNGTVTLWDMRGKAAQLHQKISVFPLDPATNAASTSNNDLIFTPEGRHIIVGNSNGTVSVLRLAEVGQLVK